MKCIILHAHTHTHNIVYCHTTTATINLTTASQYSGLNDKPIACITGQHEAAVAGVYKSRTEPRHHKIQLLL